MSAPAAVSARPRLAWDLFAALAAYVLLRVLVLHTNFDALALWMYELYPMGTLAEFLQRGVDFPLHFYYDNAAGQLLSGFLTLPCFAIAGPTYLALKIVPFVLGLGVLLLAWRWMRESCGRLAANLAVWSLVLAPTTYFKYSLTNSGNHFENLFFSLLAVAAFARLLRSGASPGRLVAFGGAAGFALFVFLGALLPIVILCGLLLCVRGWRAFGKDLPWIALGFVVGELPLLVLNLTTGGRGLGFLGAKFAGDNTALSGGAVLGRIGEYLGGALPRAATYPDALGVSGATWGVCFFAALALAWIASWPFALRCLARLARGERSGDWPLVIFAVYVPLSALAFGVSNLRLDGHSGVLAYGNYRYYLPLFLYGMLGAALLAAKAWHSRGIWRAGVALVPLGVLLPGLANLSLVDWHASQTGLGSRYSGYDLSKAARGLLSPRNGLSHEQQLGYLEHFPALLRVSVARAIGFNRASEQLAKSRKSAGDELWSLDLCGLLEEWPRDLRAEVARGAGIGLRSLAPQDAASLLPGLRRTLAGAAGCSEFVPRFLEGLASANPALPLSTQTDGQSASTNGLIGLARARALPEEHVRALVRGQGLLCGELLRRGIPSDLQSLDRRRAELSLAFEQDFFEGLGQGCALGGEAPGGPPAGFVLPESCAGSYWTGFVRELRSIWAADPAELEAGCARILAGLGGTEAAALRRALEQR